MKVNHKDIAVPLFTPQSNVGVEA